MAEEVDTQFQPLLDDEEQNDMDSFTFEPARPKRRVRGIVIAFIILLVVLLAGGGLLYWSLNRKTPVQYTQSAVTSGNISTTISATGPINANAVYSLNFGTTGQVSEIDVHVGEHVDQGQTLAKLTIDKTALQNTIDQDQLAVVGAQDALNAAEASLGNVQNSLGNTQNQNAAAVKQAYDQEQNDLAACTASPTSTGGGTTVGAGTPTPVPTAIPTLTATQVATQGRCEQLARDKYTQAIDQTTSSNTSAQSQLTSSQSSVTSAQNNLDKAKAQLKAAQDSMNSTNTLATLTAPASGTVAGINGVIGQNVGSGSASSSSSSSTSSGASSAFITVIDTGKLTISSQVNEADIGNVQVGQPAHFTLAAYPSTTFRATVASIELLGQTTSNVVTYTVILTVDTNSLNNAHIYPGMTATVNITTAQRIGVLLLPASALSFTTTALQAGEVDRTAITALTRSAATGQGTQGTQGTQTASSSRVVLILKDGKLTPVLIKTGLNNGQYIEVLSGLQEGDQVVVSQTGGNTTTSSGGTRTGGGLGGGTGGAGFGGGGTGGGGTRTGGGGG